MSEQQTDYQPRDQDYDRQYAPHDNGQFHHAPDPIKPVLKLSDPSPRQSRAWPLTARLAVAVLIMGLATITGMSLISIRTAAAKASQASQAASQQQGTINALRSQLAAVQAKVGVPVKPFRLPAIYQHYGICVSFSRNTGTGDLVDVNLTTPTVSAGSYSCGQGSLVSVVPAP